MMLALYFTNKCNVIQGFCNDWIQCSPSRNDNLIPDIPDILNKAKGLGFNHVAFSGGESTLYFDELLGFIKQAKNLGFYTQLKTNGWWGGEVKNYADELRQSGLDYLRISFDSRFIYPGSPLTQKIFGKALVLGFKAFIDRDFAIVSRQGDPLLESLYETTVSYKGRDIHVNVEDTPLYKSDFRLGHDVTGLDSDDGVVKTVFVPFRNFRFTVDAKKRVFISSEGIAEAEIAGTLTDRYVGDLNQDSFDSLKQKFDSMI